MKIYNQVDSVPYLLRRRKKLTHLLQMIASHPGGISTSEIVSQSYGSIKSSIRSRELEQARMGAARKQIQRANEFLKQCQSSDMIIFCKSKRLWLYKEVI